MHKEKMKNLPLQFCWLQDPTTCKYHLSSCRAEEAVDPKSWTWRDSWWKNPLWSLPSGDSICRTPSRICPMQKPMEPLQSLCKNFNKRVVEKKSLEYHNWWRRDLVSVDVRFLLQIWAQDFAADDKVVVLVTKARFLQRSSDIGRHSAGDSEVCFHSLHTHATLLVPSEIMTIKIEPYGHKSSKSR